MCLAKGRVFARRGLQGPPIGPAEPDPWALLDVRVASLAVALPVRSTPTYNPFPIEKHL